MTTLEQTTTTIWRAVDAPVDEAQLAAAAFLARYSGRTLDAYRYDLRAFFQWASDNQLLVLNATRPHIELYRAAMEERGLAASTIDRRLSTVCGFYRFAHIGGRIASNPAQYVRRPRVQPSVRQRTVAKTPVTRSTPPLPRRRPTMTSQSPMPMEAWMGTSRPSVSRDPTGDIGHVDHSWWRWLAATVLGLGLLPAAAPDGSGPPR